MRKAILALFSLALVYVSSAAWLGNLRVPWLARQVKTVLAGNGAYVPNVPVHQRRKAAVLGSMVADAATMPLHWCGTAAGDRSGHADAEVHTPTSGYTCQTTSSTRSR